MESKVLNKKNKESLKNKLAQEYKQYLDKIRELSNDEIIDFSKETTKKNQIYEYLINSLEFYDSEEIKAMLSTPKLLQKMYEACKKNTSISNSVSIPVEDTIDDITFDYLDNLKHNKKHTIWNKIKGLSGLSLLDDDYEYDDVYYSIPVRDYSLPKKYQCPTSKEKSSVDKFLDDIENNNFTPEKAEAISDAIAFLNIYKKHENKYNHDFNERMNKLLPKLKEMQLDKNKSNYNSHRINKSRNERIR